MNSPLLGGSGSNAALSVKDRLIQDNVILLGSLDNPQLKVLYNQRNISGIIQELLSNLEHSSRMVGRKLSNMNAIAKWNIIKGSRFARDRLKSVKLNDVKRDDLYNLHVNEFVLTVLLNGIHHSYISLCLALDFESNLKEIALDYYRTELNEINSLLELEKLVTAWDEVWSTNTVWPILTPKLCEHFGEYLMRNQTTMKQNFVACYSIRANINFVMVNDVILKQINDDVVKNLILVLNRLEVFILFYYHLLLLCTRPSGCHYNWFTLVLSCIPIGLFTEQQLRVVCDDNKTETSLKAGFTELLDLNYVVEFREGNPILNKAAENTLSGLKERVQESIAILIDKRHASRLERLKSLQQDSTAAEEVEEKIGNETSLRRICETSCGREEKNEENRKLVQKVTDNVNMTLAVIEENGTTAAAAAAVEEKKKEEEEEEEEEEKKKTAVGVVSDVKRREVEQLHNTDIQKKISRLDDILGELRRLLQRVHRVTNDPFMTELFIEGDLLEFLDSQTCFLRAEDCRHPNLSNVTELPRPVFQDFGVGSQNLTFNTFNPFFASTILQIKHFEFYDNSVDLFTREMVRIANVRQTAARNGDSRCCNITRNETMALDITMNKVYEAILRKHQPDDDLSEQQATEFFDVALSAEIDIRTLELERCNQMKKVIDAISLDAVMTKPGCVGTLKLFTMADIQHKLYPKVISPSTLTLPSLNDEKISRSPDLTQQFRKVQDRLLTLYKQTYDSYLINYESTVAIQNVLAQKTEINLLMFNNRVGIELFVTHLDELDKLATFTNQFMTPTPVPSQLNDDAMDIL